MNGAWRGDTLTTLRCWRRRSWTSSACARATISTLRPTLAGAEAGVRAIFCEKPMAMNLGEADRMVGGVRAGRRQADC